MKDFYMTLSFVVWCCTVACDLQA